MLKISRHTIVYVTLVSCCRDTCMPYIVFIQHCNYNLHYVFYKNCFNYWIKVHLFYLSVVNRFSQLKNIKTVPLIHAQWQLDLLHPGSFDESKIQYSQRHSEINHSSVKHHQKKPKLISIFCSVLKAIYLLFFICLLGDTDSNK